VSSNWKAAGLTLALALSGGALLVVLASRRVATSESGLHRDGPGVAPATEVVESTPLPQRSDARTASAEPDAPTYAEPGAAADVLGRANTCLDPELEGRALQPAELDAIWECLHGLDWSDVPAEDLAAWLCATKPPMQQAGLVNAAALHAREPQAALAYLSAFDPECLEFRESSLQLVAVEWVDRFDPIWVEQLGRSMTAETLFTGETSEQGLLLAEFFLRRGDGRLQTVLEQGGRGEHGGSDGEMNRAAAVTLFVSSTLRGDRFGADYARAYAESLVHSPTAPASTGSALAAFLSSKQTWQGGDSKAALRTLSLALDDPGFGPSAAAVLWFSRSAEGPEGCDRALWDEVYAKVQAHAQKSGWSKLDK